MTFPMRWREIPPSSQETLYKSYLFKMFPSKIRGGTISYFSVNIRDRVPGHMVLDAFCPNKTEFFLENFEN